ncbi:MAG: sugar kinase [Robiginitomaculum sp.]
MTAPSDPIYVFGEAMIELSNLAGDSARIGVAGDSFNAAVYLSRSGIQTRYVSAFGDDSFSQRIVDVLKGESIDTRDCIIIANMAPGLYAIDLDNMGERSFTYWRSDSAARRFFDRPQSRAIIDSMKAAKALYLSGITLSIFNAAERAVITDIARAVKASGGQVAFDTNYRAKGWEDAQTARAAINAIMPFVTIALPTWEDERDLFGDAGPHVTAARWSAAGVDEVVVKAGARGAYNKDVDWIAPAQKIRPLDTTGAGDSFNGAYLAARLSGGNIEAAMRAGHDLAAKVLMASGAILPADNL